MEDEDLRNSIWLTPKYYAAFNPKADPVGDYCIYSRHRDSSILESCNYDLILEALSKLDTKVYDFRASCSMTGWVEYIIVPKDSNKEALIKASRFLSSLMAYPVLDDDKYSELCDEAKAKYWKALSIAERIELIQENDGNIFAARKDYISENADPNGFILEDIS